MGRKSDAKERLLKAAAELLPERGYTAVGVQELCEAADVKPGSFYYLYPSKQQLVLDMLQQSWEYARQSILEPIAHSEANGLQKIDQFFLRTYEIQANISEQQQEVLGCTFGNIGTEMANQDQTIRQKIQEIFSLYVQYLQNWLGEASESGHSSLQKEQLKPTAEAIFAYYEGISMLARIYNQAEFIQRASTVVLTLAEANKSMF